MLKRWPDVSAALHFILWLGMHPATSIPLLGRFSDALQAGHRLLKHHSKQKENFAMTCQTCNVNALCKCGPALRLGPVQTAYLKFPSDRQGEHVPIHDTATDVTIKNMKTLSSEICTRGNETNPDIHRWNGMLTPQGNGIGCFFFLLHALYGI